MKKAKDTPLIKINSPTGLQRRPNHPDFWTTEECKKNKITGIRHNNVAQQWEFWILGNLERTVSFLKVSLDKNILTKTHVELFGLHPPENTFIR